MRRYIIPTLIAAIIGMVVGPVLTPTLGSVLRPLTRGSIRLSIGVFRSTRRRLAELSEMIDDITSEATQAPKE